MDTKKPREDSRAFNPGRNGGRLKRGGTNKGAGRPPDEFKRHMRELASAEEVDDYLRRCLRGEEGAKAFLGAIAHVTDRGYGKAAQPLTGEGGEGPVEIVSRRYIVKARADDKP